MINSSLSFMICVIVDNVSGDFSPLFLVPTREAANRQFAVFLGGVQFNAENYDLYSIGSFLSDPPTINNSDRTHLANGLSIVNSPMLKDGKDV